MHSTMGRPPIHPKRLLLAVSEEWLEAVDRWRGQQRRIPNQSEAIRQLVEIGLKAEEKPKPRGGKK
jgi:hypothetical protein